MESFDLSPGFLGLLHVEEVLLDAVNAFFHHSLGRADPRVAPQEETRSDAFYQPQRVTDLTEI